MIFLVNVSARRICMLRLGRRAETAASLKRRGRQEGRLRLRLRLRGRTDACGASQPGRPNELLNDPTRVIYNSRPAEFIFGAPRTCQPGLGRRQRERAGGRATLARKCNRQAHTKLAPKSELRVKTGAVGLGFDEKGCTLRRAHWSALTPSWL